MVNIKKFPRGILDQVISSEVRDGARERASWSGPFYRPQAEASSFKLSNQPVQSSSHKRQARRHKPQALSHKPQAL